MDYADPNDIDGFVAKCRGFAAHGVTHVHGGFRGYFEPGSVKAFGNAVVPRLAEISA